MCLTLLRKIKKTDILDEYGFVMRIDDIFKLTVAGVVVVGKISKGTIYSHSEVLIIDIAGKILIKSRVLGLEILTDLIIFAQEGQNVAVKIDNIAAEDICIGNFIVIEKQNVECDDMLWEAVMAFCRDEDIDICGELVQISNGSQELALQLYFFIPTILFRVLFPEVGIINDDEYIIAYPDNSRKSFSFSENPLYNDILNYIQTIRSVLDKQSILNILNSSVEFDILNQMLGKGSQIEDIRLTSPVYIIND